MPNQEESVTPKKRFRVIRNNFTARTGEIGEQIDLDFSMREKYDVALYFGTVPVTIAGKTFEAKRIVYFRNDEVEEVLDDQEPAR